MGGRYPKDIRWTGKLETAGWKIVNQGENGRSIPRLGVSFADAGKWRVELTFDGVHFSGEGRRAFAAGLSEVLKELH